MWLVVPQILPCAARPALLRGASLLVAFKEGNDVLFGAVQGIADLIIRPGMINVDFADVKTVMSEMGSAMMGTGAATGEGRAREAAERAINSPLLDDIDLSGAKGLLVNITAGLDLSLGEFSEVGEAIEEIACDDATVVIGTVIDPTMADELIGGRFGRLPELGTGAVDAGLVYDSSGNSMTIQLTSDESISGDGFELQYSCVGTSAGPSACRPTAASRVRKGRRRRHAASARAASACCHEYTSPFFATARL